MESFLIRIIVSVSLCLVVACDKLKEKEYGNESGYVDISNLKTLFKEDKAYKKIKVWPFVTPAAYGDENSYYVSWLTDKKMDRPYVEYNLTNVLPQRVYPEIFTYPIDSSTEYYFYRAKLAGLLPNKEYRYTAYRKNLSFASETFQTKKIEKQVACSLVGTTSKDKVKNAKISFENNKIKPDFTFLMGDPSCFQSDLVDWMENAFSVHRNRYTHPELGSNWMSKIPAYLVSSNTDSLITSSIGVSPYTLMHYNLFGKSDLLGIKRSLFQPVKNPDNSKIFKTLYQQNSLPDFSYSLENGYGYFLVLDSNKNIDWNDEKVLEIVADNVQKSKKSWKVVLIAKEILSSQSKTILPLYQKLFRVLQKSGVQLIVTTGNQLYYRTSSLVVDNNTPQKNNDGIAVINIPGGAGYNTVPSSSLSPQWDSLLEKKITDELVVGSLIVDKYRMVFKLHQDNHYVRDTLTFK